MKSICFQNFFISEFYQLTVHRIVNVYKLFLKISKSYFYRSCIIDLLWFLYFFLHYYNVKKELFLQKVFASLFIFFILLAKPFFYNYFIFSPISLIKFTLLRSSFVHKTTREQFEYLTKSVFFNYSINYDTKWLNNYFFFAKNFFEFTKKNIFYINLFIFKKKHDKIQL